VDDLIDNILIQTEFAKYGFVLSAQDVEKEIDQIASRIGCHSRSELERRLRQEGSGIEEVRFSVRNNMMVQLMLYRQIRIADPVSPREIYEYYQANENTFSTPEKVVLAMLKLSSNHPDLENECTKISDALKNDPAAFAGLVQRYSPELGDGELGEIECRLLRPEFAAAFTQFADGMIVGPIKIYDGMVWLKVISYTPVAKMPFETVEARIKLELEQRNRERVINGYAARLRSKAIIEYYF
jgi:parvulin-like peptidyl-prolyl isomerase